jgi:hypothetical protein
MFVSVVVVVLGILVVVSGKEIHPLTLAHRSNY